MRGYASPLLSMTPSAVSVRRTLYGHPCTLLVLLDFRSSILRWEKIRLSLSAIIGKTPLTKLIDRETASKSMENLGQPHASRRTGLEVW